MKIIYLLPLMLLSFLGLQAQSETEPNNDFTIANPIARNAAITGTVNTGGDQFDYFRAVLPIDGTLKVYVEAKNNGAGNGYLYMYGYDRRKTNGQVFSEYIKSSSTPAGATIYDTLTVYGRAADTFYFRLQAVQPFGYTLKYDIVDTSINDVEPNNSFAEAIAIAHQEVKQGHIGYRFNGTDDASDYYMAVLPQDGTLKVYVDGTNTSAGSGYLYMYGYDRRKANGQFFANYIQTSSAPKGASISDTITMYGRAADTVYFRIISTQSFSYHFSYEMKDVSENDIEPNNTFETAVPVVYQQEKKGHIAYLSNGGNDADDYYQTVLPFDGTLKIILNATNRNGSSGYMYLRGYDKRKGNGQQIAAYVGGTSSVKKDSTITDTLTIYGLLSDTFYFRVQSAGAFEYSLKYDMTITGPLDEEPNNTFDNAIIVQQGVIKAGQVGHQIAGNTDNFDYFKTTLPADGTLKIYIKGTNNGGGAGYLFMYGYDRRKANGQVFSEYINSSNTPAGATIYDTITVYGRAADTFYFRLQATQAFSYTFSYDMVDATPNDEEPNNTFDQVLDLVEKEEKQGHIGYLFNGTDDGLDYYRTVLPTDGTLKIYVQGKNQRNTAGYLYMYGYDRRKANGQVFSEYIQSSSTPAFATIYDTILIYGRAADTFYFRIQSLGSFSYSFSYEMVDTSANDIEPNNTFDQVLGIKHKEEKQGHIGYLFNGTADGFDYYRTVLPTDGTLKVYVQGKNERNTSGYLYMYGFDQRKASGQVFSRYIRSASTPAFATINDTITIHGRAADTFYFRVETSGSFSYTFSYEMVDTSTNDVEPNNTFETANDIAAEEEKSGHIGYLSNGTDDANDYFKTTLPSDGTVKIVVEGKNRRGSNGYLYLYVYDRRKASGSLLAKYVANGSSIKADSTIYDTIMLHCRAADTMYFRFISNGAFSYRFSYSTINTSPNDVEPNGSFAMASPTVFDSIYNGHVGYVNNGVTDANDYYYAALPARGSIRIITEAVNTGGGNSNLRLFGYTRRSTTGPVLDRYIGNSTTIPAGTLLRDTIVVNCVNSDTLFLRWTSSGCFRYAFNVSYVDNDPKAAIVYNEAGSLHEFVNTSTNANSYLWKIGTDSLTTNVAPPLQSLKPGGYQVRLIAKNTTCNFADTATHVVVVKGLDRYTPNRGGPGNIEFTAYGGGFTTNTHVKLKQGGLEFSDSVRFVNSHGNIYAAIIDMHNAPQGLYDVEITTPDTSYFIPGGYTTDTLVDKLKTEIIGRDIIRQNTKTSYAVRVHNEGNTMAGLVEVFVLFPNYMTVTLLDSLIDIVGPQLTYAHLDTFPIYSQVTTARGYPINGRLYSFYIAGIPSGGFKDLSFMVNSGVGRESIYVWTNGPLSGSEYRSSAEDCYKARLKLLFDLVNDGINIIPGADCLWNATKAAGSALYSLYSWATGGSSTDATNSSSVKTTAGLLKNCSGEIAALFSVPLAGAPGAAIEYADAATDIAVLLSNADVNYSQIAADCPEDPEEPNEKPVDVRTSLDPNAKSGPAGYKPENYIIGTQKLMNYTVFFENVDTATLPAQEIRILDTLDKSVFNLATFRAQSFAIGSKKYPLPKGAFSFSEEVPFNERLNVRISVNMDTASGVITTVFKSIDKLTGAVTEDPLEGFLPPNTMAPEGEGNISYAIDLVDGLPDGTAIRNKAYIYFDNNEPIVTDVWLNTLDGNLPRSTIKETYRLTDTSFVVTLSGNDPSSGVKYYRFYLAEEGGPFKLYRIANDSVVVVGIQNRRYDFYAIAIDSVGNVEGKAAASEASFTIRPPLVIVLGNITATKDGARNRIHFITLHEDAGDHFELEKSSNGKQFTTIAAFAAKGQASAYTVFDEQPKEGRNYYRLKTLDKSGSHKLSKVVSVYVLNEKRFAIEAYPNPTTDKINISLHGTLQGNGTIQIINSMGKVVQQYALVRSNLSVDLRQQPAGTYFIRYTDNKTSEIIKVQKQ